MMETPKVFESEYKFCLILWENEPIKSGNLVKLCKERLGWKSTTTYTVIKRLSERGVIKNENTIVSSIVSKALKNGATVAVPNDTTNEARALLLLQDQGLIKLKDGAGLTATKKDIVENKKDLAIKEIEAAQIPRSLKDVDIAVVNGNYALEAGLKVNKDALATEDADSIGAKTYGNVVAVKKGNEKTDATKALIKALKSDTVKKYINDKYDGAVVPLF